MEPEQRHFLAIYYWLGIRENGSLIGPVLVSTYDFRAFHLWDELDPAVLEADEYEVVKVYPLGLTSMEAERLFAREFFPAEIAPRAAVHRAPLDDFPHALEPWSAHNRSSVVIA